VRALEVADPPGPPWAANIEVEAHVRAQRDAHLRIIGVLEDEMAVVERELRRFARADRRALALQRSAASGRSWSVICSPR
jgi:hypothetical protein